MRARIQTRIPAAKHIMERMVHKNRAKEFYMKNWKHGTFAVLIAALAIAAFSIACDNGGGGKPELTPADDPNEVKDRTTTITVFGGSTTITVKGNFDKAGLDTAAGKIAGRLNDYYDKDVADYGETVTFDYYKENYATRGAVYIVEANPVGYTKFKMIGDGKTAYIALDYVDTDEVIGCMGMFLNNSTTVVKATPTANKGEVCLSVAETSIYFIAHAM